MTKKAFTGLLFLGLFFSFASIVSAQTISPTPTIKPNQIRKEIKDEFKEKKEELRDELKDKLKEDKDERKNIVDEFKATLASIKVSRGVVQGEITGISGTSLPSTIQVLTNKSEKNPKTITLNITDKTILLRKFGASSSLAEMHVGDKIIARGIWADDTKLTLNTESLRDNTIQKKNAILWGKIISIATESSSLIMSTQRGDQTIKPDSSTKYTNRNGVTISFADMQIGHWIRVSGVWDTVLKLVEEVKNIKDWSLPPVKK